MHPRYLIILLTLGAIWGASFLFMRIASPVLGPVWLIESRVLIAGLALLPVILWLRQQQQLLRNFPHLLVAGFLSAALPFSLLAYVTLNVSAGVTAILNATVPIFGVLLALFVIRERILIGKLAGVILGFIGVMVLVAWHEGDGQAPPLPSVIAGLLAALSYAIAAYYSKHHLHGVSPLVFATGSQLGAALCLLPLLPLVPLPVTPDTRVIMCVLALALFSTALGFIFYFHLLREIGPSRTLTVTYLIPVFAILWGRVFLGEAVTVTMAAGCLLILGGTALATGVGAWKRGAPAPASPTD